MNMNGIPHHTYPPTDMQSPELAYILFYAIFFSIMLVAAAWTIWHSSRTRSLDAVLAFVGGSIVGFFVPPLYNKLSMVWFPSNIPMPYMTVFGMHDPMFDLVGNSLFFGTGGYLFWYALTSGHSIRAAFVLPILGAMVAEVVYQVPFLQAGMYIYYGDQPFRIGGLPAHWIAINVAVPVVSGYLMYWLTENSHTKRQRQAAILTAPAITAGFVFVVHAPVTMMLYSEVPTFARQLAGALCIALCVGALVFIAKRCFGDGWPVPAAKTPTPAPNSQHAG